MYSSRKSESASLLATPNPEKSLDPLPPATRNLLTSHRRRQISTSSPRATRVMNFPQAALVAT
jgi:hypothetical protein